MNNEERILEILIAMQGDIQQINHRLDSLETRVSSIETKLEDLIEAHEETRASVNILIDWAIKASDTLNFPLPKIV